MENQQGLAIEVLVNNKAWLLYSGRVQELHIGSNGITRATVARRSNCERSIYKTSVQACDIANRSLKYRLSSCYLFCPIR